MAKIEKTLEHYQSGCVKHEIFETFTIYVTHISSRDEMTLFQFVSKTIRNPEKRRADVVTFGGGALRDIPGKNSNGGNYITCGFWEISHLPIDQDILFLKKKTKTKTKTRNVNEKGIFGITIENRKTFSLHRQLHNIRREYNTLGCCVSFVVFSLRMPHELSYILN